MSRIFYFCPDFPQPSGGTKTLYRHVRQLCQQGFDAAIVHQKTGFMLTWHGIQAPVIALADRPQFQADDILVIPEVMLDFIRQTEHFAGQRVIIALSWAPAYHRLPPGGRWQDYGIQQVMTVSPVIKHTLEWSMGIAVTLIHEYIDAALYAYQPAQKKPQIAYMTRKDSSGEWLHGVLARRQPTLAAYTWLPLREMTEAIYAQSLRSSTLYLATTMQEGMHISVLEAMACGCLVVGYAGVGGHAYMQGTGKAQNCILVENGNLPQLGEMLEEVLLRLHINPHQYDHVIEHARSTVHPYQDAQSETDSLQAFFVKLGANPNNPAQ
ncbi:MAG: glycosyltransferase family 4 protein [Chloroflexi bacterium]|nr:glycosyltransferase family 4 protein [Chloroflexota bacterium]